MAVIHVVRTADGRLLTAKQEMRELARLARELDTPELRERDRKSVRTIEPSMHEMEVMAQATRIAHEMIDEIRAADPLQEPYVDWAHIEALLKKYPLNHSQWGDHTGSFEVTDWAH